MEFIFVTDEAKELIDKVKAKSEKRKGFKKSSDRQVSDAMAHAIAELDDIKRVDVKFIKDTKSTEDRATPRKTSSPNTIHSYIRENKFTWHRKDYKDPRSGQVIKLNTRLVLKYILDLKEFCNVEVTLTTKSGTKIPY